MLRIEIHGVGAHEANVLEINLFEVFENDEGLKELKGKVQIETVLSEIVSKQEGEEDTFHRSLVFFAAPGVDIGKVLEVLQEWEKLDDFSIEVIRLEQFTPAKESKGGGDISDS